MNLKAKVYLNRINVDYKSLFTQAQTYMSSHGVNITFDFVSCSFDNLTYQNTMLPQGIRCILHPVMANIIPIDASYDFTMFCFNGEEFPPPNIPNGYTYVPIKQPFIDILLDARTPEANYLCIIHELMHGLAYLANVQQVMDIDSMGRLYYNNDQPDSWNSNFGEQWELLINYIKSMPTYIYFQPSEIVGLKPELVSLLDQARGIAGIPFKITSGLRNASSNALAGGVQNSTHLLGEAVDLSCNDSVSRLKMVSALLKVGFTRIGIYLDHIHADLGVAPDYPSNVMWCLDKE